MTLPLKPTLSKIAGSFYLKNTCFLLARSEMRMSQSNNPKHSRIVFKLNKIQSNYLYFGYL